MYSINYLSSDSTISYFIVFFLSPPLVLPSRRLSYMRESCIRSLTGRQPFNRILCMNRISKEILPNRGLGVHRRVLESQPNAESVPFDLTFTQIIRRKPISMRLVLLYVRKGIRRTLRNYAGFPRFLSDQFFFRKVMRKIPSVVIHRRDKVHGPGLGN